LRKEKNFIKYVALLRGINVGGNKKVPMAELKKAFELLGFIDVKTLLNSGNVVFDSQETDIDKIKLHIEQKLEDTFGFVIPVMIRTHKQIQDLIDLEPFKIITITPETRLYVTFLTDKPQISREIPYISPDKHFRILQIFQNAVLSVLVLSREFNTTNLMAVWEKELGKNITTRNWNTIVKLSKL
jgi:uncharacterized protein (DUF1697 family)